MSGLLDGWERWPTVQVPAGEPPSRSTITRSSVCLHAPVFRAPHDELNSQLKSETQIYSKVKRRSEQAECKDKLFALS